MKIHINIRKVLWVLICPLFLIFTTTHLSVAQSSLNYKLVSSVADQGGAPSQSSNFGVVDAVGQASPLGLSSSANYKITSGFFSGIIVNPSTSSKSDLPDYCKEFLLFQNYPNPFTTMTTIRFSLPEAGHVKLDVYSISGKHIETLFNEYKSQGVYSVNYNGTTLSPGVYMYKIQTKQFRAVKMMNSLE
jgi:Secretion system C-terminal sorting domain